MKKEIAFISMILFLLLAPLTNADLLLRKRRFVSKSLTIKLKKKKKYVRQSKFTRN